MKKLLTFIFVSILVTGAAFAKASLTDCPKEMTPDKVVVLTKGEPFSYPLQEGAIIECYANRVDGSIDEFNEYNDYFIMRNGKLYSNTMQRIYKPEKKKQLKKVDQARILGDNKTLKLYDPLWEGSIRHHMRTIKINTQTGDYYMKGTQDNWMWYRNITATGCCRVINPR